MKGVKTRRTLQIVFSFAWFLAVAAVERVYAGDYYTYQSANGDLVISNNAPPPGRKIIKTQTLSEVTDQQIAESQVREAAGALNNRLSSLEQTIGDLAEKLRAQSAAVDNLPQGHGDVAVGVTQGVIVRPLHRPTKRPTISNNDSPRRDSRATVSPSPQQRTGGRTGQRSS